MKVTKIDQDRFEIDLNEDELSIICQCMNEPCNGFQFPDFLTKIGKSREEVRSMLDTLFCSVWKDQDESI